MIARLPFLGFVFFYAAGILIAEFFFKSFPINSRWIVILSFPVTVFSVWSYIKRRHDFVSLGLSLFLFLAGVCSTTFQNDNLAKEIKQVDGVSNDFYEAVVKTLPEKRKKSVRLEVSVQKLGAAGKWTDVEARALLSIPLEAEVMPAPGDYLIVRGKLEKPHGPMNPEEFDYQNYLQNKGIGFTGYLPVGSYEVVRTEKNTFNPILWSVYVSEWADKTFRSNIPDDRSYGLVKAMLLGRRDDLRSDQIDDYTTSGTVHILSVSGMHVAMIFLVISFLCGWMKRLPGGKLIYLATVTFLLVFYSIVTGFPPSVQRATVMCLVLVMSEVFNKKHNSVNTLGVSAFLILLLDPHALFDVGFQLSYLAMLGIFLFYRPLEKIWIPDNRLLKMTWQITALSFAAQLVTFPVSIYYFHQFPSYFWLVNPFVIGFTNILLPAAMVLLAANLFPLVYLQMLINWLVQSLAWLTNFSVSVPKALPGFVIENLSLDGMEMVILFFLFFAAWYAYESRDFKWLRAVPVAVTIFAFYAICSSLETYLTSTAIIHSVPKHAVISFKEGNKLFISSDSAFASDTNAYNFHLKNYAIKAGATERIFIGTGKPLHSQKLLTKKLRNGLLLSWEGKAIYQGKFQKLPNSIDYMLVSNSPYPHGLISAPNPTKILLGDDLKRRAKVKWKFFLKDTQIPFHDLDSAGALSLR